MKVLKFGGTSVGSPQRMWEVADLINDGQPKVVVLSAVAGTTNKLVRIGNALQEGNPGEAAALLHALRAEYLDFTEDLLPAGFYQLRARMLLDQQFGRIESLFETPFTAKEEKIILAQGELISTQLFQLYLEHSAIPSRLIPAFEFMRLDAQGEPDMPFIRRAVAQTLDRYAGAPYFITQGYICLNHEGEIDNLQRGGSDYTATLLGAALDAGEIQIWTDIDGLHNNDPRVVKDTYPVRKVSYREAAELAYFGAKILHPTCVIPAEQMDVPIRLKNTMAPQAPGTLISGQSSGRRISAIAAKDGITAIKIRSGRMLNAYGFLRRVFEVFEQFKTPIDMIATSEVAVSLTIDNPARLEDILRELAPFGEVSCDSGQSIICIVGDQLNEKVGVARDIFDALEDIPIRMVSYGGSNNNVSVLVAGEYKNLALQALQRVMLKLERLAVS
ncbi:MAG: aspartate kinase [Lewinellaceae bacterium]|nr:aspartate kinase [Lewinella sp.]MCB9281503.1 aspartate kinase [Lewinellaceae bacterium]